MVGSRLFLLEAHLLTIPRKGVNYHEENVIGTVSHAFRFSEKISREPLLDLTDEQIADFDQLQDDTYAAIEPLEEQIRVLSVELLGILMADTIVIEDAEDTLTQILAAQCDSISIGAASLLEGVQILTPEQRQRILGKIERKQNRWGMWRNRK